MSTFYSCKREYTCVCIITDYYNNESTTITDVIIDKTKSSADSECSQREIYYENTNFYGDVYCDVQ